MQLMRPVQGETLNQIDTAREIGVTDRTLRQWTKDRKVPFSRIGRTVRYPRSFVEAFKRGEYGHAQ